MMRRLRKRSVRKKKLNWFLIVFAAMALLFIVAFFSGTGDKEEMRVPKEMTLFVNPLPYGIDSNFSKAVKDARAFWEKNGAARFTDGAPSSNISVIWVTDFQQVNHTDGQTLVRVGLGDTRCGRWMPYTYDTVVAIALHELGHVIGLPDSDDIKDGMFSEVRLQYGGYMDDSGSLQDGRSVYYPVCEGNVTKDFQIEMTSSEELDIYIVQSRLDYEGFLNGDDYNEYDCGEDDVEVYSEICNVYGAGVILKNPSNLGQGPTANYRLRIREI